MITTPLASDWTARVQRRFARPYPLWLVAIGAQIACSLLRSSWLPAAEHSSPTGAVYNITLLSDNTPDLTDVDELFAFHHLAVCHTSGAGDLDLALVAASA